MYFALVRLHTTHNLVNFKPRFLLSTIAPVWRGALTILFDPCFQDEGLIFATDFHPILARGRPVDPQSTPNMGQMRSRWGERWPHLFVWLRQFNQSTKQLQIDLRIPILMKTSVPDNQDVIERLTRAMKIRRGGRQR